MLLSPPLPPLPILPLPCTQVEVLTQELWSVQSECDLRVQGLESRLSDQRQQLEVYEKLERELDEVVMQAAQSEDNHR